MLKRSLWIVTLGWLAAGVPLLPADDPAPRPVIKPLGLIDDVTSRAIVSSGFVFAETDAPTPQIHASTIVETPQGLAAAWFAGTREKHNDVGIWVSRHVNGKWTPPVEVMNGVQHATLRYPCWNPVLYQQPEGPLHLYSKCGPDPKTWWGTHQVSHDHGATWSQPVRLPAEIDGPVRCKPVLLPDGTLLCGSSTEYDGWRVHFELTQDNGQTWERVGPINEGKEFGAIQPTILVHAARPAGTDSSPVRLQALCRHQQSKGILSTWSDDLGRTWSPLELTSLPNPNSGIDAVSLKDGRQLLIYNHTPKGRSPLNLALSQDGVEWQAAHVLESEPGEYSYPAIIQTADGLVHMVYTWKRRLVKHVVVDPTRLSSRPITNGEWPR